MGGIEKYKEEFIRFLIKTNALKFGEFTLKSGRKSPYFVNTGSFDTGESISKLGFFYASKLFEMKNEFDIIYGPAYKGIPLCLSTAIALAEHFKTDKPYTFNRKEAKDHGDVSAFVGHKVSDGSRIVILDDVFTTGETKYETVELLSKVAKVIFSCVLIAVDRQEVGQDGKSAIKEFEKETNIPVKSIVTIREIIDFLHNKKLDGKIFLDDALKNKMEEYLAEYGVKQ